MRTASSAALLLGALVCAAACGVGNPGAPQTAPATVNGAAVPFTPDPPGVYVAKVKDVLVGLPPTDDEVAQVTADPTKLRDLITGWMQLPEYSVKMARFFELSFQQTQVSITDFADQVFPRQLATNAAVAGPLLQNMTQSFARTVLALIAEGAPFTETMTTQRFMMTPAMMESYAFIDAWHVDDAGNPTDRFAQSHKGVTITVEHSAGPIPLTETLDPTSPNYMHWYDPDVGVAPQLVALSLIHI